MKFALCIREYNCVMLVSFPWKNLWPEIKTEQVKRLYRTNSWKYMICARFCGAI
jgi:hypothetical protein